MRKISTALKCIEQLVWVEFKIYLLPIYFSHMLLSEFGLLNVLETELIFECFKKHKRSF